MAPSVVCRCCWWALFFAGVAPEALALLGPAPSGEDAPPSEAPARSCSRILGLVSAGSALRMPGPAFSYACTAACTHQSVCLPFFSVLFSLFSFPSSFFSLF